MHNLRNALHQLRARLQQVVSMVKELKTRLLEWLRGRNHLILVFLIGFLLGNVLMKTKGADLVKEFPFLNEESLLFLKDADIEKGDYLKYLFRNRLWFVVGMVVLATTYLGIIMAYLMTFGFGAMFAVFFKMLIEEYGLKGLLLGIVSIFPQYLLYFPAFFLLMGWCIRFRKKGKWDKGRLAVIAVLVCLGCLAEAYINLGFLQEFLTIF